MPKNRLIRCKKCKRTDQNGGRGLCPSCYYQAERDAKLGDWPKMTRAALREIEIQVPPKPLAPRPGGPDHGVTVRFEGEALKLWERIVTEAKEQWRTPELQILFGLSKAFPDEGAA